MTLVLTPLNESQKDLLIKLAEELHIKVEVIDDDSIDTGNLLKLADSSFSKEWESEEDSHWDELKLISSHTKEHNLTHRSIVTTTG